MTRQMRGIVLVGKTYYARKVVPADVRAIIGKTELIESLKTGDPFAAQKIAPPILARFDREIAEARRKLKGGSLDLIPAKLALAAWSEWHDQTAEAHFADPDKPLGDDFTPFDVTTSFQILDRIANQSGDIHDNEEDLQVVDARIARTLTNFGCPATVGDSIIEAIRREFALVFLHNIRRAEQLRLYNIKLRSAQAVLERPLEEIGRISRCCLPHGP